MAKKPIKTPKKIPPKVPGLPKNATVKVIEITPKTFLIPLLVFTILWSLYRTFTGYMGENITYNDTIGLNEITAQYQSGTYEEIVIIGNQIEAKKP